jgi:hypothetical protein
MLIYQQFLKRAGFKNPHNFCPVFDPESHAQPGHFSDAWQVAVRALAPS